MKFLLIIMAAIFCLLFVSCDVKTNSQGSISQNSAPPQSENVNSQASNSNNIEAITAADIGTKITAEEYGTIKDFLQKVQSTDYTKEESDKFISEIYEKLEKAVSEETGILSELTKEELNFISDFVSNNMQILTDNGMEKELTTEESELIYSIFAALNYDNK